MLTDGPTSDDPFILNRNLLSLNRVTPRDNDDSLIYYSSGKDLAPTSTRGFALVPVGPSSLLGYHVSPLTNSWIGPCYSLESR